MRDSCFVPIDRYWSPDILGPLKENYEFFLAMFVFAFIGCFLTSLFTIIIFDEKQRLRYWQLYLWTPWNVRLTNNVRFHWESRAAIEVQCWCRSGLWKMENCRCKLYCRRSRDHYCLYLPKTCGWRKALRNVGSKPVSKQQQQALKDVYGK